ncbi:MAG TPA: A24 family peptidase [Trebonia sp.]|nr:A24 family peptidase [Trebonia sp.]
MTLPWIVAGAVGGVLAGPRIRASVFARGTEPGRPLRRACPACARATGPGRHRWRWLFPVTGRCPACRARIGPPALSVELAAGAALAVAAARAGSAWELAGLAWLALLAVPLTFIDISVRRLPDPLTAAAFAGTLALLAVAAVADGQPGHLARAAIGAAVLPGFYLTLFVISPSGIGLGDAKLAAGVGTALGWLGWQSLLAGTFITFVLAAVYGGTLLVLRRATRASQLPLGPFIAIGALAAIAL